MEIRTKMTTDRFSKISVHDMGKYYQLNLTDHLLAIEYCSDQHRFRNYLFAMIQLYHDALIADPDCRILDQETRSSVLDELLLAGRQFTGQYFEFDKKNDCGDVDLDEIRNLVLAHDSQIVKYNSSVLAKGRHLEGSRLTLLDFKKAITYIRDSIDVVVMVASGGIEPGCLAAYVLNTDCMVPARYSHVFGGRDDTEVKIHRSDLLEPDKKILIVEDMTLFGESLKKVTDWVMQHPYAEVYAAVVFGIQNPFTSSYVVYNGSIMCPSNRTHIWKYRPK